MRNRFILTSKPSLINTKNVIIKEYDASDVDKITVGFVRSKHSSGGLIIGLFGGVRAFMLQKEASRLGDIKFVISL
ncbi:unnamed protein product [Anisakis simplex]|uniref:CAT_RBD domain-containing protein n=1 Tax=Anisakis simplex TaxID=6269 RepID=A0A0M3JM09_ANISI|nr:unnamed protein product [Anisakis simplex]